MIASGRGARALETVSILGHRFTLLIEGSRPPGRYEVRVWQGRRWPWRPQYLRAPIRGRTAEEARERTLDILHNYVGLERFRRIAEDVARRAAPGAGIEVSEDAREVTVTLTGPYRLEIPLAVGRGLVLDRDADPDSLRGLIRAHLESYSRPR